MDGNLVLRDILSHRTQHALLKVVADALNRKEKLLPRKDRHRWKVGNHKWTPGEVPRAIPNCIAAPWIISANGLVLYNIDDALDALITKIRSK